MKPLNKTTLIISIFTATVGGWSSCFLSPNLKPAPRNLKTGSEDIVAEGSYVIERSDDGLSASIRFETTFSAFCQLSFYPQDETKPQPDDKTLAWLPCVSAQPGRVFSETISALDPAVKYTVAVNLWSQGQTPEQGTVARVKEHTTPGDPSLTYVIRVDSPTLGAQTEALKLSQPLSDTQAKLTSSQPCQWTKDLQAPEAVGSPQDALALTRVSSRGFFSGVTDAVLEASGVRAFRGSTTTPSASDWIINIQGKGTSGTLRPRKPALLKSAKLTQGNQSTPLDSIQLDDTEREAFHIKTTLDAAVSWTIDPLLENTVVAVTLVSHTTHESLSCRFSSKEKAGSIPKDLLARFTTGRGYISASVETVEGLVDARWLIWHTDWRAQSVRW